MTNLAEVYKFLVDNGYLLSSKAKGYTLSKKFQQDIATMKRQGIELIVNANTAKVLAKLPEFTPAKLGPIVDWSNVFIKFIQDAQVPERIADGKGSFYSGNKYSEPAMKKFKQMLESGIDFNLLVRSTTLYYKSAVAYKKIIGNYIIDGDWRTDYFMLQSVAEKGVDALAEHVKKETNDGTNTPYRVG